ncbi:hypothetical protein QYE76_050941 [Lolium multiflorum]|uniref:Uncharacterized protein n=1 Tax=Lolium multiflorum TaxID=4521 RepID=A0AAD8WHG1_LOLMU|nr:hypothetical protein QYE76_050941 [Lolium multiflorum]
MVRLGGAKLGRARANTCASVAEGLVISGDGGRGSAKRGCPWGSWCGGKLKAKERGQRLVERDEPHSYRYSPEPRWRTTPSSWETAAVMKMAVVSMEEPSFPVPAACRNGDSCPPDLGFAMAAALEGFACRGLFVSGF